MFRGAGSGEHLATTNETQTGLINVLVVGLLTFASPSQSQGVSTEFYKQREEDKENVRDTCN